MRILTGVAAAVVATLMVSPAPAGKGDFLRGPLFRTYPTAFVGMQPQPIPEAPGAIPRADATYLGAPAPFPAPGRTAQVPLSAPGQLTAQAPAAAPSPPPVPEGHVIQGPIVHQAPPVYQAPPVQFVAMAPLFHRVEIEDPDHIHPLGVPAIVQVPDPCACDCGHCHACHGPQCVSIQICVPPCPCPDIKVRRGGRYIEYDYGDYEVEISVRKGYVKVDYDD